MLDAHDTALLSRTIRFSDQTAAEAMVPRPDMVALYATATLTELAAAVREHGYSRYPLLGEDSDDVVGVVLAKDLFRVPTPTGPRPSWAEARPPCPGGARVVPARRPARAPAPPGSAARRGGSTSTAAPPAS